MHFAMEVNVKTVTLANRHNMEFIPKKGVEVRGQVISRIHEAKPGDEITVRCMSLRTSFYKEAKSMGVSISTKTVPGGYLIIFSEKGVGDG